MSNNTVMFPGSGDVFIKFHDILGTPKFSVLTKMIRGQLCPGLFNLSFLEELSVQELICWYITRPKENFLDIDDVNKYEFTSEQNANIMQRLLLEVPYDTFAPVNLMNAFILHPIADRIHVYSEKDEPQISGIAENMVNQSMRVEYTHGEFSDIIRNAKDQCTLITTSTEEVRKFLESPFKHRYAALIHPNVYDPIKNISDVYSKTGGRISIIDLTNRIKIWEESLI